MENDTIVVRYFPLNGRSSLIKCMLDVAKVKFTLTEYSFEEWFKLEKPDDEFEYKTLPTVSINGKFYGQTIAIELLLARKLGFLGETPEEEYEIVNLLSSREDMYPGFFPVVFIKTEEQRAKLDENYANLIDNYLKWLLPIYNKKVKERKGKYLLGDKLSLGDMFFSMIYTTIMHESRKDRLEEVFKSCAPDLIEYSTGLIANELKDYYETGTYKKDAII